MPDTEEFVLVGRRTASGVTSYFIPTCQGFYLEYIPKRESVTIRATFLPDGVQFDDAITVEFSPYREEFERLCGIAVNLRRQPYVDSGRISAPQRTEVISDVFYRLVDICRNVAGSNQGHA